MKKIKEHLTDLLMGIAWALAMLVFFTTLMFIYAVTA